MDREPNITGLISVDMIVQVSGYEPYSTQMESLYPISAMIWTPYRGDDLDIPDLRRFGHGTAVTVWTSLI